MADEVRTHGDCWFTWDCVGYDKAYVFRALLRGKGCGGGRTDGEEDLGEYRDESDVELCSGTYHRQPHQ